MSVREVIYKELCGETVPIAYFDAVELLSQSSVDAGALVGYLKKQWKYQEVAKIASVFALRRYSQLPTVLPVLFLAMRAKHNGNTHTFHYLPGLLLGLFQAAVEIDRSGTTENHLVPYIPDLVVQVVDASAESAGYYTSGEWEGYRKELGPFVRKYVFVSEFGLGAPAPRRGYCSVRVLNEGNIPKWKTERKKALVSMLPALQVRLSENPRVLQNTIAQALLDELQYTLFAAEDMQTRFEILSQYAFPGSASA